MPRRKGTVVDVTANGQQLEEARLREAVEAPGAVEPPAEEIRERPELGEDLAPEIGERTLENDDPGERITLPPELITVKISRPTPHIFLQFYPDRVLRTALLAYRPSRDSSPEFYFVAEELEKAVSKHLKNVMVLLVSDMDAQGESFLWIVPRSEMSPYYGAISLILGQGEVALKEYVFRVGTPDLKTRTKTCSVHRRRRTQDDPAPILPTRKLGVLLYEALGNDRVIKDKDHPVFQTLTAGSALA
jgi:hypothetical protein